MAEHTPHSEHDAHGHDGPLPALPEVRPVATFTDGGHEVDNPPGMALMGALGALAVVIVGTAIMVFQLFVMESNKVAEEAAESVDPRLAELRTRDATMRTTFGVAYWDGKEVGYRIPIDDPTKPIDAKQLVLKDPSRFAAAPAPADWVHPDDAKNAPPADEQPTDEQPTDEQPTDEQPTDEQPTDEQPTEPAPTEPAPTDEQPTDAEQPEELEPAQGEQPTGAEPTETE